MTEGEGDDDVCTTECRLVDVRVNTIFDYDSLGRTDCDRVDCGGVIGSVAVGLKP